MENYLGEIRIFAGNFAPQGWLFCQGQLLAISQNQALFALLGTTYGGDGQTTFSVPDLRGRAAVGLGAGPGLSPYQQGQQAGYETVTLTTAQLPVHQHPVLVYR
jgi:microcystin-dependent protein